MISLSSSFIITSKSDFFSEANADSSLLQKEMSGIEYKNLTLPLIVNVSHSPQYPLDRDKVLVIATILGDNSTRAKIIFNSTIIFAWYGQHWGWGIYEWTLWELSVKTQEQILLMTREEGTNKYVVELMELPYMTKVSYKVSATNDAGTSISDVHHYYVVRGAASIIYTQLYQILEFIGYLSVILILTIKIGGTRKK